MLFSFFRRKKQTGNKSTSVETESNGKWNKMWTLWADGKIESPYNELMSYHSDVNNGGHYQFFSNTDNIENSEDVVEILCDILPLELKENLKKAYGAYINLENDMDVDNSERIIEECDSIFFENEDTVIKMFQNYSEQF